MGYVATQPLRWGADTIPAGAPVPAGEQGRDYAALLHLGQIREVDDTAGLADSEAAAELKKARARITELESGAGSGADDLLALDELPSKVDGVELIDGRPGKDMTREIEVEDGTAGEYRKRPTATVKAARLVSDVKVLTPHGVMDGHEGDWLLVNTGNGEAWPVDPSYFDENYEEALAEGAQENTDADAEPKTEATGDAPLPEGVTDLGGGWFELPNGKKVRKKDIAQALAEGA